MGYYTYCDLFAFEFRVKDDFALGINAGQCALASANNYSQFECLFNMGTISLRFYL